MWPRSLPKPRRWTLALIAGLTIWGLTDVRRRGYAHPENPAKHRTDLTVYTEAGAAFFDGRAPYEVANPRGWRYLYPPMFALLLAPLHALASQDQVTVWFFVCLLICWGCFRELRLILRELCESDPRLAAGCRRWFPWLGVCALATGLLPTLNCLQRGQVGVLKLYLLFLGLRLIVRGRGWRAWIAGGTVLAMPVVLKIVPVLPVALLLFVQLAAARKRLPEDPSPAVARRRLAGSTLGVALGLVLFFLLVPAALIGWKANLQHLGTFSQIVLARQDDSGRDRLAGVETHTVRNQSFSNAVYRFGNFAAHMLSGGPDDRLVVEPNPPAMAMDAPIVGRLVLGVRLGLLAALAALGWRLGRPDDALGLALAFALACVAMLVVSPISRGHYFMLLAPAVLLLPLWLDRQAMPRAATAMAVVPAVLSVLHYLLLDQAGRVGLLGLGTTAWLVAVIVLGLVAGPPRSHLAGSAEAPAAATRRPQFSRGPSEKAA
ncbi:MAG: DUF2029 domain-containing protein [Pirellulales bacterium]|nr:DUF2029 domain-containing protein [Pirellulales bacterium]